MRPRPVLYPLLIGVFPVVHLYAQNAREVVPGELAGPVALALAAALLLWGLFALLLCDAHRAGLIAAVGLVLFWTVARAGRLAADGLEELSGLWVRRSCFVPALPAALAESALAAGLAWLAWKKVRAPRSWTPALNLFALTLVAQPAVEAARVRSRLAAVPETGRPALARLDPAGRRPDIYYIILDSFARPDVQRELFDNDLSPFVERLRHRGFYVADRARSNYCQTPLSLSSSLNADFHPEPPDDAQEDIPPDPDLIRNNAVMKALRPLGYRFVSFSSGFQFTECPGADRYLSPYSYMKDFHRLLIEATPLRQLAPPDTADDLYTQTRERTLYLLEHLPDVARIPGPTFTFAHALAPHPPFVFGADGEDVSPRDRGYRLSDGDLFHDVYGGPETYVPAYRAEAAFVARAVERTIDRILAESPEPPIILLQSDHGSGLRLDMHSAERTDHRERMGILSAFYFPGGDYRALHPEITPVNSFRVVLNTFFGARLPLLPDESYYSTWPRPFGFVRVTDEARGRG